MMTHPNNISDNSITPTPYHEDEWWLHHSDNAILNDLEDALTGQRHLDLTIVQTYANIILQSEAHIREVHSRINHRS
jgi:hypothetical protein